MRVLQMVGLFLATCLALTGCGQTIGSSQAQTARNDNQFAAASSGLPIDVQVGDPGSSYASVEFTKDGRYMVWYEGVNGNRRGRMWHCAVNADTGAFDPPDCKGYQGFDTSAWGRANVGLDAQGPYYVGANTRGEVIMVRPTGARSGTVTKLPTPANPRRKGYYPTQMSNLNGGYVVWIQIDGDARELQYIDLSNPSVIRTVERQTPRGRVRLTPMEIGFFRVVNGKPYLTYGAYDNANKIQVKMKDMSKPDEPARFVTQGSANHVDPYGFIAPNGTFYMVAGIDAKALMYVYKYNNSTGMFVKQSEIRPPSNSQLANPVMATSFEPIYAGSRILGTYQINDGDASGRPQRSAQTNSYITTAFEASGEIWLTDITNPSRPQVRLSGTSPLIRTEPEPLAGRGTSWVYYNAAPTGTEILNATWQLRRSEVPLN